MVDLGCWPGSWLQVALERIGPQGRALGIDVAPMTPLAAPNVRLLLGDVRDPAVVAAARVELGRPADVVLSDVAPKLTGVAATDEARSEALVAATLAALPELLRTGGRLLLKLLTGRSQPAIVGELRRSFAEVTLTRPEATRRGSSELYAVARGFQETATTR